MTESVVYRIARLTQEVIEERAAKVLAHDPYNGTTLLLRHVGLDVLRIGNVVTRIGNTAKTTGRLLQQKFKLMAIVVGPIRYEKKKITDVAARIQELGSSSVETRAAQFVGNIIRDYVKSQNPRTLDESVLDIAELLGTAGENIGIVGARLTGSGLDLDNSLTLDEEEFVTDALIDLGKLL